MVPGLRLSKGVSVPTAKIQNRKSKIEPVSEPFDPYRDWLGIDSQGNAVDHYRILSVPRFEGDPRKILAAVNAAVARLEKIDPASYPLERLRLMDELQAAKRCLLNPAAKSQYDAALAGTGRAFAGAAGRRLACAAQTGEATCDRAACCAATDVAAGHAVAGGHAGGAAGGGRGAAD